jgi:hypothetical protein
MIYRSTPGKFISIFTITPMFSFCLFPDAPSDLVVRWLAHKGREDFSIVTLNKKPAAYITAGSLL